MIFRSWPATLAISSNANTHIHTHTHTHTQREIDCQLYSAGTHLRTLSVYERMTLGKMVKDGSLSRVMWRRDILFCHPTVVIVTFTYAYRTILYVYNNSFRIWDGGNWDLTFLQLWLDYCCCTTKHFADVIVKWVRLEWLTRLGASRSLNKRDTDVTAPPYFLFLHIIQLYNLIRLCVPKRKKVKLRNLKMIYQQQCVRLRIQHNMSPTSRLIETDYTFKTLIIFFLWIYTFWMEKFKFLMAL